MKGRQLGQSGPRLGATQDGGFLGAAGAAWRLGPEQATLLISRDRSKATMGRAGRTGLSKPRAGNLWAGKPLGRAGSWAGGVLQMLRDHQGWSTALVCLGLGSFSAKTGLSWANWDSQSPWDCCCLAVISLDGALVHWGLGLGRKCAHSAGPLAPASSLVCCREGCSDRL